MMNLYTAIHKLMPIVYPSFYTLLDIARNELVFLETEDGKICELNISDKTQCEAVSNHYHLFEKVGKNNCGRVVEIGKSIANNLLHSLAQSFPAKNFIVYLEVNAKDSVIIRFHQIWENEPPYFDMTQNYNDVEIFEFKTDTSSKLVY